MSNTASGGLAAGTVQGTIHGTDARTATDPAAAGAGGSRPHLPYVPALDGLRAVALVAVLCFHQGFAWAHGGFLGVSTFFTLSGFLITTLALGEWAGSGRLSPARFYERRARRLLPAALLTLVAVVGLRAFTTVGNAVAVRGDLLASLGYAANWRFASSGDGYAALFTAPSPVLHFWSLAIEEQFYLLFPLLLLAIVALARRFRHRLRVGGVAFAALAAGSFALAYVLAGPRGNDGAVYYGTHTRAGELLVGVALAFALTSAPLQRALGATAGRVGVAVAGPLALAGLVVIWHRAALDGDHLFRGYTALNAALSCVVIVAALQAGILARCLGLGPLRGLGRVSYGAYLFHWPIFLLLAAAGCTSGSAPSSRPAWRSPWPRRRCRTS